MTAAFSVLLYGVLTPALKLSVPMWDPIISFERQGFLLSTVLSLETLVPQKPAGYETETARQLLERLEEEAAAGADTGTAADIGTAAEAKAGEKPGNEAEILGRNEAVVPENVICIMNESFADLRIFNGLVSGNSFETDGPFLSYYDSLSENAQKGWLYVPVFGAMTANSEYEFLTEIPAPLCPRARSRINFIRSRATVLWPGPLERPDTGRLPCIPIPAITGTGRKPMKIWALMSFWIRITMKPPVSWMRKKRADLRTAGCRGDT